ncbi:hypothetical protein [Clostridium cylindrosporum]|uniref:Biotin transporter BioY n=1 Tax=Clostridium cylindrosporum DSM 605 TaxID=1121307 RepID=A0A0J8D4V9_CLOCY|nr:hypothetical protein [Clostridium cylindrosporum]KMT20852.1 hypothetical protein CLCY_1c00860 [Clostridium cylindrosporum DSM 605]
MRVKSQDIVLGGISVALIVIFLYLGTIIITNKMFFMALSIILGSIPYIKGGIRPGVIVYLASATLGFLIVPNKLYIGVYIIFGIYPFVKLVAERFKPLIEYIIKYTVFNILLIFAYFIYAGLVNLGPLFKSSYLAIGLFISFQVILYIFDFAFTKFIIFIEDRILKRLKY